MKIVSAEFVCGAVRKVHYPPPEYPELAFAGRSNVGKSSAINKLLNRKKLVKTSSTPGKTRQINFFLINGSFFFVDLPGYGYAKVSHAERSRWKQMIETYLSTRETLKGLVLLCDIRHPSQESDLILATYLKHHDFPFFILATKADKLSASRRRGQIAKIAASTGLDPDDIICFSAKTGQGKDEAWKRIMEMLEINPCPQG